MVHPFTYFLLNTEKATLVLINLLNKFVKMLYKFGLQLQSQLLYLIHS